MIKSIVSRLDRGQLEDRVPVHRISLQESAPWHPKQKDCSALRKVNSNDITHQRIDNGHWPGGKPSNYPLF